MSNIVNVGESINQGKVLSGYLPGPYNSEIIVFPVGGYPKIFSVQANVGRAYSLSWSFINGSGYVYTRGELPMQINLTYNSANKTVTISNTANFNNLQEVRWYAAL